MGRPFTVIGLSMFASLFFIGIFGITSGFALLALCAVALVMMLCIKKLRRMRVIVTALAAVVFASLLYIGAFYLYCQPATAYFGKDVNISGTLHDYPDYKYDKYYTEMKVQTVNGKSVKPFLVRISFSADVEAEPGDTLQLKTTLYEAGSNSKFTKLNNISKGIYATAFSTDEPKVIKNQSAFKGFSYYLAVYRKAIVNSLMCLLPKNSAALAAAVLIGEKSYIPADALENINTVGISHIICVSGLHLSVLGFMLMKLFDKLHTARKVKYIFCAVFIFAFMALCGFTSSVVRAGIMFLIFIIAELILAEPDSLNSLGIATVLILLNPFAAGNIGFIFSFTATFSIITAGSKACAALKEKWSVISRKRFVRFAFSLLEIIIISICVNAFCMPFSILIFKKISFISIIANVFILPLASALLISCGLTAVLGMLPLGIFGVAVYPLAFVGALLCSYILHLTKLLSAVPFSNLYTGTLPFFILGAVSLLVIAGCVLLMKNTKRLISVCAVSAVLFFITSVFLSFQQNQNTLTVRIHSLKNSVCITAALGNDFVLVDAGNHSYTCQKVKESLFHSSSNNIDYFLISSSARNKSGRNETILRSFEVENVVLPPYMDTDLYQQSAQPTTVTAKQYTSFTTKNGMRIFYYNVKFCAVYLYYNGTGVLYVNTPDAELSVLPEHMRTFDYLICGGKINKSFSNVSANAIIEISGEASSRKDTGTQNVYATDSLNDIYIQIRKQSSTIGRESAWQQ